MAEHFRDATARAEDRQEISTREPLLFHPELNRLDRIWVRQEVDALLVRFNEDAKRLQFVRVLRTGPGVPQAFDLEQAALVVVLRSDGTDVHGSTSIVSG